MSRFWVRVAASSTAVAVATLLVWALEPVAPTLSLGVLYVFAVLPVAVACGIGYALPVAVASMLAFNWFFLPPRHTLTLADGTNWFALAVYSGTAVVVSELAARSRRRAADAEQREREASLLAEVAGHLLAGREIERELPWIGDRSAEVLGVGRVRIELGPPGRRGADEDGLALAVDGRRVGALVVPRADATRARAPQGERLRAALAALLAVAVDRERLQHEALEAEMLRRSDLVKTALLRAVSHDLRSPLTGITTAVGALRAPGLALSEDDRSDLLETIAVDAGRLARLVGDLLDLSRLEAGGAAPEPEVWALDDLVRDAIEHLDARDRIVVAAEPALVRVDAVQVERVLANLVENALKFSPAGAPVHIRIAATSTEATVRVVDQGPGVADGELERVFEPFYRSGADRREGAGLGLAIARGFAEANGGRVWAESRLGQGATFALALPVASVPVELSV
ncbi:MAG TPA: ATP-binding protein [Gaiellaceae bacterium]|nr:ATP-binding protein [Gaiellaceae bacterium]